MAPSLGSMLSSAMGSKDRGNDALSLRVIGTNQGVSSGAIYIVYVHFTQDSPSEPLYVELLHHGEVKLPQELYSKVQSVQHSTSPEEISVTNVKLGEFEADTLHRFAEEKGISLEDDVDLIGSSGLTIWHPPFPDAFPGKEVVRAPLDIAEISIIAARTGITTVGDFRVSDVSLGRQDCPLFSALDALLVNHPVRHRAVQHLDGIAHVSLSHAGEVENHYDFDTGPGNVLIDAGVRYLTDGEKNSDSDGAMGASGTIDQCIVDEVMGHAYFAQDIPKTTARETFDDTMAQDICKRMRVKGARPEDCVATITRITAESLLEHYLRYAPKPLYDIYMCGDGSYNPNIVNFLRENLHGTNITTIDDVGVPAEAEEALAFAFYACEAFVGRPLMVPRRAESDRPGIIGHVQPGDNHFELRKRVVRFWGDTRSEDVLPTKRIIVDR